MTEKQLNKLIKDVTKLVNGASITPIEKMNTIKILCNFDGQDKTKRSAVIECDFVSKKIRISIT